MTRDELDIAALWAKAERWNPGRYDTEAFYSTDPKGFFVGELDGKNAYVQFSAATFQSYLRNHLL